MHVASSWKHTYLYPIWCDGEWRQATIIVSVMGTALCAIAVSHHAWLKITGSSRSSSNNRDGQKGCPGRGGKGAHSKGAGGLVGIV